MALLGCGGRLNVLVSPVIVESEGDVRDGRVHAEGYIKVRSGGQMPCPPRVGDFGTSGRPDR